MPHTAVKLPFETALPTRYFLPQGWKFFTRNPREPDHLAYVKRVDGKWASVFQPNGSPTHFFGIIRYGRARSVEMGLLLTSLQEEKVAWTECKKSVQICAPELSIKAILINNSPDAKICGDAVFSEQPPVPWAWSTSKKKITMPSKLVKTRIECKK